MNYTSNAINNLQQICLDCKDYGTADCIKAKCNVGFSLSIVSSIDKSGLKVVNDGLKLIPKDDMKPYENRMMARCIASICKLCKECNENHSENCAVSLARKSLETIVLKEMTYYPGNILTYVYNVSKENPGFANLIQEEIMQL